jgi:hypothetical protein
MVSAEGLAQLIGMTSASRQNCWLRLVSINDRLVTSRAITFLTLIATHKGNFSGSAQMETEATFGNAL